nr:hypothetical protein HAGR004_41030 [Bdellovibrio sp. HAGR004]
MKLLATSLLTICLANVTFASTVKLIKAETQLYAGTSNDVITNLEIILRKKAVTACGSGLNISGLSDYQIKFGSMNGQGVLKIDLNSPDYSGALVWSNQYPTGEATAKVVCR